jgi:hypothetical protein
VVVGAIGFDAARHARRQHDHLAFVALPLLLAAHQLDEALVTSATSSTCTPGSSW